jgi:cytochrome bd-type quinol oxidase subunit 1
MGSLLLYMVVYLILYPAGVAVMAAMVRSGPARDEMPPPIAGQQSRPPITAVTE